MALIQFITNVLIVGLTAVFFIHIYYLHKFIEQGPINSKILTMTSTPKQLDPIERIWNTLQPYTEYFLSEEEILNTTRSRIKNDMANYSFTGTDVSNLNDLLKEAGGEPHRTIVISTWRSGSMFLGEILNSVPATYYHYEPKHPTVVASNLLKCNYTGVIINDRSNMANPELWEYCKRSKKFCTDIIFLQNYCKLFPFHILESVQFPLDSTSIEDILNDEELNVKIVYLVRDPRAVIISRVTVDDNPIEDFKIMSKILKVDSMCKELKKDYALLNTLNDTYANQIISIRYEELALFTERTILDIFMFLGISVTPSVMEHLNSITNRDYYYPTYRNSNEEPAAWVTYMDIYSVLDLQTKCKEPMTAWGYRFIKNGTNMTDYLRNPLLLYSFSKYKTNKIESMSIEEFNEPSEQY